MKTVRSLTLFALLAAALAVTPPAQAATITVTTFEDELNTDGDCSLREALASANSDGVDPHDTCSPGSGADTVVLPAGTYTRTEAATTLDVTSPVTIDPTGVVIIDGNDTFPLFEVSSAGSLTATDLTIRRGENMAGGAIFSAGTVTLDRVTLESNQAIVGGAIYNFQGALTARNTTISQNSSGDGGGLHNDGGTTTLNNVTLAVNAAATGGGFSVASGTVTLSNTLVGDNIDTSPSTQDPDCSGTATSAGYNLIEDPAGCTIGGDTTGNITGQDPLLFALNDFGGPTQTHGLREGSPAIDAGNPAPPGSSPTACEITDQRGVKRPRGPRCDIGAYELKKSEKETCLGKKITLEGSDAPDVLVGTSKRDVIQALGGDDVVTGLDGNDRVCGGSGNDRVNLGTGDDQGSGQEGNDRLNGAAGDDTLSGQAGRDRLTGKGGDDILKGGPKPDNLNGGGGIDTCRGGGGGDRIRRCE